MNRLRLAFRPWAGWVLAALGALALFLGWYGVSGTAVPAKQLPYLVSGGLTGIGLLVVAAALFAADDVRQQLRSVKALESKVEELYRLLTEEVSDPPVGVEAGRRIDQAAVLAVEGGSSYHRSECRLVRGKSTAATVTSAERRRRGLTPCRLCDPAAAGPG